MHPLKIHMVIPGMPFDGETMYKQSLGGSETAAACMARELARLGHSVTVLCNLPDNSIEARTVEGVEYGPLVIKEPSGKEQSVVDALIQKVPCDVLIVQRLPRFLLGQTAAKLNFLWNHDLATKAMAQEHVSATYNLDGLFVLSEFMLQQYRQVYPFIPEEHLIKTRNGIDLDLFDGLDAVEKIPGKVMYCSRPERGLWNLVKPGGIMETLLELSPSVNLCVAGYSNFPQQLAGLYSQCHARIEALPNCTHVGYLSKSDLYKHYAEAELILYPMPWEQMQEFDEIFCITAIEGMAAGTPMVSTNRGALPEVIGKQAGVLLDGPAWEPRYQQELVKTVSYLLGEGRDELDVMKYAAQARAKRYGWDGVAKQWQDVFFDYFKQATKDKKALARHFLYYEDVMTAKYLAEKHDLKNLSKLIDAEYAWAFSEKTHRARYEQFADWEVNQWDEGKTIRHFDSLFQIEPRWHETRDWFIKNEIPKGAKVLDVGCGCGFFSVGLANMGFEVVGIDIAPKYLEEAEKLADQRLEEDSAAIFFKVDSDGWMKAGHVVNEAGNVKKYFEHGQAQYDIIYLAEIIEHVTDPLALVKSYEPYLAEGGRLLVSTPFGPWKRQEPKDSKVHHLLHLHHLEWACIEEMFGKKEDFQSEVIYWRHTPYTNELCGWFMYSFGKGGEYGELNIRRKVAVQNPRPTISVCMIAKDEERIIGRALRSIYEIADEIILADTGSTDGTNDIARQFGAHIHKAPSPLKEGFEASRNASIRPAQSDWILWVDCDEELQNAPNLLKFIRRFSPHKGFRIRQHHFSCDGAAAYKVDKPVRVFRNNMGIQFYGMIHEHPETGVNKGIPDVIELGDVEIAHSGYYVESARRKKFWRNLEMLKADRAKYPERILGRFLYMRDLMHLAQYELENTGNQLTQKAITYANEAIQIYRNTFMTMGGHMQVGGLKYYSSALQLLKQGREYTWSLGVSLNGGGQAPATNRSWFANDDDFTAFLGKLLADQTVHMEGPYLR